MKRSGFSSAIVVALSYLILVLACACLDAKVAGPLGVKNVLSLSGRQPKPCHDADDILCSFIQAHKLSSPAPSPGSQQCIQISFHSQALAGEARNLTSIQFAFRPPGSRLLPRHFIEFQLSTVLRV